MRNLKSFKNQTAKKVLRAKLLARNLKTSMHRVGASGIAFSFCVKYE